MIPMVLGLRPSSEPAEATAWLIAGGSCSDWFDELARWQVPLRGWRGAVLPRSLRDPAADSLLVVPGAGCAPPRLTPDRMRAAPWVVRAGRLAHPADAALWPPVSDEELLAELVHELTVVHPGIGVVGFTASDLVDLTALLAPPPQRRRPWSASAAPSPGHLTSVEARPMTLAEIYQATRDDIGGTPLDQIPMSDKEAGTADWAAAHLTSGLAKSILALTSLLPHDADARTWVNHLEDWARNRLTRSTASLEAIRHRELARLLQMLDSDIDTALRYALPIGGGENTHRGIASPGARLTRRDIDFDLARLGGGQPMDPWSAPGSMRQTLEQRYRAAAQREIGLGRHRRAAYILSHLLGDHASAARALEQGRHWREAAILWREQLKQPRAAASCLERGELWAEAAQAWGKLMDWERHAICLARNGEPEAARAAWEMAINALILKGDIVSAAMLTDQRLSDPEAALGLLADAWPDHPQAAAALGERLGMLGRLGRHQTAIAVIAETMHEVSANLLKPVLETLVSTASGYPHEQVRLRAADAGRCVLGAHLVARTCTPAALALLPRLDPGDRLLGRDLARWTRQISVDPRMIRSVVALPSEHAGKRIFWKQSASTGRTVVAIGASGRMLYIARLDLINGATQIESWKDVDASSPRSFFLVTTGERWTAFVLCHSADGDPAVTLPIVRMPSTDAFPASLTAGTHGPIQPGMRLACPIPRGGWASLVSDKGELSVFIAPDTGEGAFVRPTHGLEASMLAPPCWLIPIGHGLCLATGRLLSLLQALPNQYLEFPFAITNAIPHPDPEESCVVLALASGAVACWRRKLDWNQVRFAERMRTEIMTFTRGGLLVICDGQTYRAWRLSDGSVRGVGEWTLRPPIRDLAVITAGPALDDVVLISRDGSVRVERTVIGE